ncbi:hypothetical protein AWJ20_3103 [Sugiyamaella lignohabitans]|uniref:DUF427 domain-containing protein n=1 Tax=Sugiyamaella lignohabitans TaxID=796027 RepID=A0A167FMB2_9ASCO|nr:uncharacterized protein AWJ20_3103 [Sugiyamaella lignohabitans]ANB15475.1 hypothetical protein AWJ20_3103 [Sugiyamaella lignohabitans]
MATTTTVNITDHSRQKPLSAEHPITTEQVDDKVSYSIKVGNSTIELASTKSPVILHEAHNPEEGASKKYPDVYYISPKDVNLSVLKKSSTVTYCPYKGYASYYSVIDGPEDVAWSYEEAYDQVSPIRGRLSFYENKVIKA